MIHILLVQTAPPEIPGSMRFYGDLVRSLVLEHSRGDFQVVECPFYDPSGGASMWRHHLWRLRQARKVFRRFPDGMIHVLDGSMACFVPRPDLPRAMIFVHDLIPALQVEGQLPGSPSALARLLIRRNLASLRACLGLATNSTQTQRDLFRFTGRTDAAVIPVPLRPVTVDDKRPGPDLPDLFVFHIGNNALYKNRMGVLDVFARLQDIQSLHLIMAGPPPTEAMRRKADALDRVRFVGQVDDGLLATCYERAAVFLFPSLYEGFGMPIMEAMAAGCPVVCSSDGALEETAGGAALISPAANPDQLAAHCRSLLADATLRRRQIVAGRARAEDFSREKIGKMLVEWYKACAEKAAQKRRE